MHWLLPLTLIALLACCAAPPRDQPPVIDLQPFEPAIPAERHIRHIQQLHEERTAVLEAGKIPDEGNFIWMGRRLAYLGRFEDAIAEFTEGLRHYPDSYRLLRHRGHRWITLRRFDRAVDDLTQAASMIEGVPDEVEPDGLPNRLGIPTSTSHTNIHYHLGLAHYLRGEFEQALAAYENCMRFAKNDDMIVATAYWLYLTQMRLGLETDAAHTLSMIRADMNVIENTGYHHLLLLYRGDKSPDDVLRDDASIDDATRGYGVGMWHLLRGERGKAEKVFQTVLHRTPRAAFGHIAAEVEMAR